MAREKEAYRDNLESLIAFLQRKYADERHIVSQKGLCEYTGRSRDFVKAHYDVGRSGITAETLARKMS